MLAFLDGHKKLLMGPSGPGKEATDAINNSVFSIYDLEKNAFVQYVPGPTPGGAYMTNWPSRGVRSPDGSLVAVSFYKGYFPNREAFINVYNTRDWRVVAQLEDPYGTSTTMYSLAFSPEGTGFAFASGEHIRVYATSTWTIISELSPFSDIASDTGISNSARFRVSALAFSPDATACRRHTRVAPQS